ncbi:MAG: NfeD family protein [Phycisphaerae bacterium]|jgi:membrane-bound ClpP family serine protease
MFWWIILAIFLFFLCAALLVAEVFVPSFGLIGICSLACLAGGLAIFFKLNPAAGWCGVIVAVIMIPAVLVFAYKIFPKTNFGKEVSLDMPKKQKGEGISDIDEISGMLGYKGITTTVLRPVGMCDFAGKRLECVAENGYLDKGIAVEVIKINGTQLTVRANS